MSERIDAWSNPAGGLGGVRDKSTGISFVERQGLTKEACDALYKQNPIAARIVDKVVDDAFRHGWELDSVEGKIDLPAFYKRVAKLQIDKQLRRWGKWGRLYGGALLTLPTTEQGDPSTKAPVNLDIVTGFFRPQIVIARNAQPIETDSAFNSPTFGQTLSYRIAGLIKRPVEVHHSRVIPFEAIELPFETQMEATAQMARNNGWGPSVLDRVFDDLGRDGASRSHAVAMMYIASILYLKIGHYRDTYKTPAGKKQLRDMLANVRRDLDSLGILGMDADDSIGSINLTITGAYELIDRMRNALAAATDMPKEILYNESPAGLNAGELSGPQGLWFGTVAAFQEERMTPALERVLPFVFKTMGAKVDAFEIKWRPLWAKSDADASEIASKDAQTDQIYFEMGAVSAAEIRQKRLIDSKVGPLELSTDSPDAPLDLSAEREAYAQAATDETAPTEGPDLTPAINVIERVASGKIPRDAGEALLKAAGMDPCVLGSAGAGIDPARTGAPPSTTPPPADLVTPQEAAEQFRVSTRRINMLIESGELPYWGIGPAKRISAGDVVRLATAHRPAEAHAPAT